MNTEIPSYFGTVESLLIEFYKEIVSAFDDDAFERYCMREARKIMQNDTVSVKDLKKVHWYLHQVIDKETGKGDWINDD